MFTGFISLETKETSLVEVSKKFKFLNNLDRASERHIYFKNSYTFYVHLTDISLFKKNDGKMKVNIKYSFNPNLFSWLLGICFFPLGFLIFLLPNKAKDEFEDLLKSMEL